MIKVAEITQELESSEFNLGRSCDSKISPLTTQFPLVSIIIPVYNGSKYIKAAVESIFEQTYCNYEVIVVDDGSTDNTRDVLKPYEDRVYYLYQANQGSASARNLGIKIARGELVAFLDADDYWSMPEKLAKQVACFNENSNLGCVNTGWRIVNQENKHIKTVQPWHKAPELNLETWLKRKCVRTSAMMFRREWLEKVGGFDQELRQSHDVDLILRLSLAGCETTWLKEDTVCYRQHEANTTKNSLRQAKYVQAVLDKFFANQNLPDHIREIEPQTRYHTLVWLAWYQYQAGSLDEMAKLLQKSLSVSPYLRAENIAHWITSFERFSVERGQEFDAGSLTISRQWIELITDTLTLTEDSKKNVVLYSSSLKPGIESAGDREIVDKREDVVNSSHSVIQPIVRKLKKPEIKKYKKPKVSPFPADLILPPFPGENNDYSFIDNKVNRVFNKNFYSLSVSIIISYSGNSGSFNKTITAIKNQTYPQHLIEIVVVTSDNNVKLELAETHQLNLVKLEPSEHKYPSLEAQNLGIKAAKNDYLILLDSDILATPYLVESYMKYFHVSERVVLLGERKFVDGNKVSEQLVEKYINAVSHLQDGNKNKDWQREDDLKELNAQRKIIKNSSNLKKDRYPFRAFISSNAAFSRKLIDKIGLFDEAIVHWGYRDQEFGYRIYNQGYYFIPVPEALGLHQDAIAGRGKHNKTVSHKTQKKLFEQKCPVGWYRDYQPGQTYKVPKVSIYIPSYNNGKYIKEAVESVLNQTYTDVEICICDDGSTDNTLQVLEDNYSTNPRVRWIAQTNGGIGKASNTAVRMCRGMYIGQLDSDDLLKPEAIATLVEILDQDNYGCVYSSCERIDSEGNYLQDEYSYPTFSREKMMLTSIAHHFRMFRRRDWLRTDGFNENLLNAVDYDMFLKLSEVCAFHHVEKMLYLRRWHGKNTSFVNEGKQSSNTHIVLTYALERMGLADDWEVYAPDPEKPRKVSYRRKQPVTNVFFFPDYRKSNIYQNLLYSRVPEDCMLYSGDIDDALDGIKNGLGKVIFHLHWTNYILRPAQNQEEAQKLKDRFLAKLFEFLSEGGQLIWTIHNVLPHNCPYLAEERDLRNIICIAAQKIHIHSQHSFPEIQQHLNLPPEKVEIVPHGNYIGVYPNETTREEARKKFNFTAEQTVFLFLGQIRTYKGIDDLIVAFNRVQQNYPDTHLLIAGKASDKINLDSFQLEPEVKAKITLIENYVPENELQYFFNAADVTVLPYKKILTSGSLLNAMSFSCPVIAPRVGMTEETIQNGYNGYLYELENIESLVGAMNKIVTLDSAEKAKLREQSLTSIKHLNWQNTSAKILQNLI